MANRGRTELREWIDQQYANEPKLRERVKELMAEMEIEQQLVALREARRVSQHTLAKVLGVIASRLSPNWRPGALRTESLKLSCVTSALLGGEIKIKIPITGTGAKVIDLPRKAPLKRRNGRMGQA